jgi:hypothetical protein
VQQPQPRQRPQILSEADVICFQCFVLGRMLLFCCVWMSDGEWTRVSTRPTDQRIDEERKRTQSRYLAPFVLQPSCIKSKQHGTIASLPLLPTMETGKKSLWQSYKSLPRSTRIALGVIGIGLGLYGDRLMNTVASVPPAQEDQKPTAASEPVSSEGHSSSD